jgi:hypothetical protein
MIRIALAAALAFGMTTAAQAEGFALKDLTKLRFDPASMPGKEFVMRNDEPERATVACVACKDLEAVDIILGQSVDGTEERYRSGKTTLAMMEAICKSKAPSCTMQAATFGRAVGWTTQYETSTFGSTTALYLNGDLLVVRSLAGSKDVAFANGQAILAAVGKQIVGD